MIKLDWDVLMHAGFGQLRLSPDQFWSLTLRELSAALATDRGGRFSPSRKDLVALMSAHPDTNIKYED